MFGQLWLGAGLAVPPDVPPLDRGAGDADGSGLAALTIATPPAAMRPKASRTVATTRRERVSCPCRGGGSGGAHALPGSMVSIEMDLHCTLVR